jgi:prevent-host-death family protein
MEVSVVELRQRMRELLKAVDRGETVTILYRGRPRAVLGPVEGAKRPRTRVVDHPAFGLWRDREEMADPSAWVRAERGRRRHAL